jgi:phenylpropionate dioxygenase-like ring-hydroxylating dioxygenase large terminal subunit
VTGESPHRSPIPLDRLRASTGDVGRAVGLPPACYTDDAWYRYERDVIFDHEWICVGRVDMIPEPGDYFTVTTVDEEPLIVVRNRAGEINVMSSVCQHRGMCVTAPVDRPREQWLDLPGESSGNLRNFRCPYHWWIYDLDGRLVGAPEMDSREDFSRGEIALPRLAVEIWQGFVFASFDADAEPLGPRLTKFDRLLENYHLDEMVSTTPRWLTDVPFDWKLMAENFMEGYHAGRLHASLYDTAGVSLDDETLMTGTYSCYEPGDAGIGGWARAAFIDRGLNPTQKALFPAIATLTEEERWHIAFLFVPPTLLLGISSDSAFWFTVHPKAAGRHSLSMAYVFPRATTEMKLFEQILRQHDYGVELFNAQDLPANVGVQVGLRSRFAPRGPLSHQDNFLAQFNSWMLERFETAEERATTT